MIPTSYEKIREAFESDAQSIASLVNSVYRGDPSDQGWTSEAHLVTGDRVTGSEILEYLQERQQILLVAEIESKIVACVQLKNQRDKAYLGMLSVQASLQASGLGSRMLAECEKFVRDQWALNKIDMWVLTVRPELINWYERKGYRRTTQRVSYSSLGPKAGNPLVDNLEFVILEKYL